MADVSVRPARASDAAEIGRIQVVTWQTAYRSVLPPAVLSSLSASDAASSWAAAVGSGVPRSHVLVALEQQWTVGFTAVSPLADPEPDDPSPETTASFGPLLVEPRWGRRGHGSRLLAAAVDMAVGDGMSRGIVWVPEGDAASRRFFASAGWAEDGLVRALDTGAGELREVRLQVLL